MYLYIFVLKSKNAFFLFDLKYNTVYTIQRILCNILYYHKNKLNLKINIFKIIVIV